LLERADVFVQNLAPGAAGRLGFGTEALRERRSRLIVCDVSGYGSSGPYRDKKAYDLLVQCEAGLVSITGTPKVPSKAGIAVADIAAGMYAYSGILATLFRRERTGQGAALEVSLFPSRSRSSSLWGSGWSSPPTTPCTTEKSLSAAGRDTPQ
jgi:crotonobetainyl-CoA:carnitine CoA-transferase CaiB-like acyl-CoA transferase